MAHVATLSPELVQGLTWRCIGPPRGGRVVAVAGHPTEPATFYFGACAGGVWKTTDGGTYWENISDGFFKTAAVGAIAVSEADPNVVYAGMGESTIRGDVSHGDGVYRSTDGGRTWQHLGLEDTRYIAKIRIHPQDPDTVYVAAVGHAFGPNEERGVFRSFDGGETWERVLFQSDKAGAIDLSLDVTNPRILYATTWEAYRNFWELSSGGPDSRIYKSVDGGDTWTDITYNPGLPEGIRGKMGIVVSPADPQRVWTIIESEQWGVYRSDNGGATWQLVSDNRDLIHRPWYYCHIFADPQDADTVYVLNLKAWKSVDGGRTYSEITTPHGDNHDLWIDPVDPQRMVEGNDGGACVSFNGGASWSTIYNQPTAQFYHVAVDNQYPYRVYGTQQDNSSLSVPSATEKGAILWSDCYNTGTGESGHIAVHPEDANIVYVGAIGSSPGGGGALQRYDHRNKQVRLITVWPEAYYGHHPKDLKYRFAWTYPITFSPHDPQILYVAGNCIFRSTTEGQSWEPISPDLSRQEEKTLLASGGPITLDTSGAEHYGTVFALTESPHEVGLLWAGTDDGLIHISRNGGQSWQDVTPPDMQAFTMVCNIEVSPHDAATAYVAATRYKLDEFTPILYKTSDYGASWQRLDSSFPADAITRVIREDPARAGLLYVGTETGVFASIDDGGHWHALSGGLPVVPVYDLVVKNKDLVAATHGRSFWILDDLTPLHQLETALAGTILFQPRPTIRQWIQWRAANKGSTGLKNYRLTFGWLTTFTEDESPTGQRQRRFLDAGENPPNGVVVNYFLPEKPNETITLSFLDAQETVIKTFSSDKDPDKDEKAQPERISAVAGLNRFVWDLRYPNAVTVPGDLTTESASTGPIATPGTYHVRLQVGDHVQTQTFELLPPPDITVSAADLQAQFDLWLAIRDKISETHTGINRLRQVRSQVKALAHRLRSSESLGEANTNLVVQAEDIADKLTAIETELVQTESKTAGDRLRLMGRLNLKLVTLVSVVSSADFAPTDQTYAVFEHLSSLIDTQLATLQSILDNELAAFESAVAAANLPAIIL